MYGTKSWHKRWKLLKKICCPPLENIFNQFLRYASTYRSRFVILKIQKKNLDKMHSPFCLSEKEVMRLALRRCDQALLDSRYLGHYSSILRFKKIVSAYFLCEFYMVFWGPIRTDIFKYNFNHYDNVKNKKK